MRTLFSLPGTAACITLAACASGDPGTPVSRGAPDVALESVSGFGVEEVTYTVPGLDEERTLDMHLWHATTDEEGERAEFGVEFFYDEFAFDGATVLPPPSGERAPLVVYSHGGRGFAGQVSPVARQFVRNGWIVVAPSHPGDNLFDYTDAKPYSYLVIRAFDVIEAIDYVESLPEEHPLSGRVDTSRVLVMGHSFGGQNAWISAGLPIDPTAVEAGCGAECTEGDLAAFDAFSPDPRVVAAISMENNVRTALVAPEGFARMPAPALSMSGTEGNDAGDLFERADAADLTWVSLVGGCHESFTGTRPCTTFDLDESLRVTATYALAFGTHHVLGSTDPAVVGVLDGSTEVSADVEVRHTSGAPLGAPR